MTTFTWDDRRFTAHNVHADLVDFRGEQVLRIVRDLDALPFDIDREVETVDEPTHVTVTDLDIANGIIEVKLLSRIQSPTPLPNAGGFAGLTFRVAPDNSGFESIYVRPNAGRSPNPVARNHSVQYFSYPGYKFAVLREPEYAGLYETYADIGLDEWITLRVEFTDQRAALYLNDQAQPSLVVPRLLGSTTQGTVGLYVDIGTIGYFKDFKIVHQSPGVLNA
ncbi:LamG domain-containing protein [Aestuariimicrobium ganziense]|uniref:hypothetical protein n=1 Tax=Aestuariimicrobium ganziense TaxID=2773677 RepID=UPI0019420850|nr:hypothetical protein [Aestuariimicrobium ganziense]